MLQIADNSRQIPKDKIYLKNTTYHDYLYGYLQSKAHWDGVVGHPRVVPKKEVNFSQIASEFNKTRQTVSKHFRSMLEGTKQNEEKHLPPLIRQKGSYYQLILLEAKLAMLVPQSTLQVLLSCLKENVISMYVYLFNRYYANQSREFMFTLEQVKAGIGVGPKSHNNNEGIVSILYVLQKLGLLKYQLRKRKTINGKYVTEYWIIWMTNELKDLPTELSYEDKKGWEFYNRIRGVIEKDDSKKVC